MENDDFLNLDWDIQTNHIYDLDFRKMMANEFNIEWELLSRFFARLEIAAAYSPEMAKSRSESPTAKATRDAWMAVSTSAEKMMVEIDKADLILENDVRSSLAWRMIEIDQANDPSLEFEPTTLEEKARQDKLFERHFTKADEILRALEEFAVTAMVIFDELPASRRGPKFDFELWYWIQGVMFAWEHDLGRKFTRDVDDSGEPISEAARMLAMAAERTPYEKTKALNMMKKVISSSRGSDIH
jgi:hypothetical protein